jgi:hypothetical protein
MKHSLITSVVTLASFLFIAQSSAQSVELNGSYFSSISQAIAAAPAGARITVGPGTYNEDVLINKSIYLKGAGKGLSIIKGVKDAFNIQKSTVLITANEVAVEGFTITRNGNNVVEWNDGLNTSGVTINAVSGGSIHDNEIIGNQVGIELFSASGDSIYQNVVDTNRIGILLHGSFTNGIFPSGITVIQDNEISFNWTAGIEWVDQADGDQSVATVFHNKIWDNWYSQIDSRTNILSQKNFTANFLGFDVPTTAVSSTPVEPSYQDQIPFMYGGSAIQPATGSVTIRASSQLALDNIVYAPYYTDMALIAMGDVLSQPVSETVTIGSKVVTSEIPAGVVVTTSEYWDGVIEPPTATTDTYGWRPSGFEIGSTVIEVGSPNTSLYFSSPALLTLNNVTGPVGYSAPNSNTWTTITETCGGTYNSPSNPSNPTGECYISDGINTKIVTYHFTRFASLIDNRPFVLTAPSIVVPVNGVGCQAVNVKLPAPTAARNDAGISFKIIDDVPTVFPLGVTVVTRKAQDADGNVIGEVKQTVTVTTDLTATTSSSFALPNGVAPNTVYIGYSPASSIDIAATVTGGKLPYTYLWSNSASTSKINVQPISQTTYKCQVSDAYGCAKTFDKTIYVKDIRCGEKLDKVSICELSNKKFKSECVVQAKVSKILLGGGSLGECANASNTVSEATWVTNAGAISATEDIPMDEVVLGLKVGPNPSPSDFIVTVNSTTKDQITLRVFDLLGRVIEVKNNIAAGSAIRLGSKYQAGYYVIEVIQANKRRRVKTIKL